MNKLDQGYYSSEKSLFKDHHANYIEEGFVKTFLVFLDEYKFLCTNWKNKEVINKDDLSLIQRGGEYKIEGDKVILIYDPSGWIEECTKVDENTILHHFSEPAKKMIFKEW